MAVGKKPMSSAALEWTGRSFKLLDIQRHISNAEFWARCRQSGVRVVAIDGPCDTNGLRLRSDWSGWDVRQRGARRDGEVALCREGIGLFWTTHATITRFDGASRWIARSLRLFGDRLGPAAPERIEVHPHGAFAVMWRRLARGALPNKKAVEGRRARLALLAAFIAGADQAHLPDHDAVDAGCAALVAGLHVLGLTRAVGTDAGGGRIWIPMIDDRGRPK